MVGLGVTFSVAKMGSPCENWVRLRSVATSWTAGASDERKILQDGSNNSRIKSFSSANVSLTAVNRRDDLPSPPFARESYNIVLHDLWRCRGLVIYTDGVERMG